MIPLNLDKLIEIFFSQRELNKDIYEKIKEEDYDKVVGDEVPSIKQNIMAQITAHKNFLDGISVGKLTFEPKVPTSAVIPSTKKEDMLLLLLHTDKQLVSLVRSSDAQTRKFTVPWISEEVELAEVLVSLIMHETFFVGQNTLLGKLINTVKE